MPAVSAQFRQPDSGQRTRADSGASFTPAIHKIPATASGLSYFFRLAGFGPLSGRIILATWVADCCLAAGEVVGFDSVLSAARMNSAIVMFLSTVEKANELVEHGLVIDDAFTAVLPLSMPSKRVTLSNVPPFVKYDFLVTQPAFQR